MTEFGVVASPAKATPSCYCFIRNDKVNQVLKLVEKFYQSNPQIKASHAFQHVLRVFEHATKALECCSCACQKVKATAAVVSPTERMEIQVATLLHDVDDSKYFPQHMKYENARSILDQAKISPRDKVLQMISWTSCSKNGNRIPKQVQETNSHHLLIPRWADRLEAVGAMGVVRAYQYNQEHGMALSSETSPRATCIEEVWKLATPERFEAYLRSNGQSDDMISHYYDKLLHVSCPPPDSVRNPYLEHMAKDSSRELIQVCLRFGRQGEVDEEYIRQLAKKKLL